MKSYVSKKWSKPRTESRKRCFVPDYAKGKDNYGKPHREYVDRIASMSDAELVNEAENKIWLSAYAANNPRSDFHWHVIALYDESVRKGKQHLYKEAYENASKK